MRAVISHSEVDAFLVCERKHFYAFGKPNAQGTNGLEAKRQSDGLYRGNLGHEALHAYYNYLAPISRERMLTDDDIDAASDEGNAVLTARMLIDADRMELITGLMVVFANYVEHYREEDKEWTYVAVEMEFRQDVDDDITFPFRVDLIRHHRKTGRVEVVDHKFLANLYSGDEIAIQPQLPKYVGSLRNLGYYINGATYNLIGHRVLKTRPYDATQSMKRVAVNPTQNRVDRVLYEQYKTIRQVEILKRMPLDEWENNIVRTANSFNCKSCPFLSICIADLNGEDTSVAIKYDYQANSYGYGVNDD